MRIISIFIFILFKMSIAQAPLHLDRWVIWNIGQGQWATHIQADQCIHYDVGGEFGSYNKVKSKLFHFCGQKKNKIVLSHWDYDHFFNIRNMAKSLQHLCWVFRPELTKKNKSIELVLQLQIPFCERQNYQLSYWRPKSSRTSNETSGVFIDQKILLPGDSPIQQESFWMRELTNIESTKILVLGHHGSRTSTGRKLLAQLPNLKMAVASARYKKYHHPHFETLYRLREFKIPVLRTEDWGNIWIEN